MIFFGFILAVGMITGQVYGGIVLFGGATELSEGMRQLVIGVLIVSIGFLLVEVVQTYAQAIAGAREVHNFVSLKNNEMLWCAFFFPLILSLILTAPAGTIQEKVWKKRERRYAQRR